MFEFLERRRAAVAAYSNALASPASKVRTSSLRLTYVGTALLILILLAANTAVILHFRATELLDEEHHLKILGLVLAEQADRTFKYVDLVISSVAMGIAAEGVTDGASFDQKLSGQDLHLLLREKIVGVPQLDAVIVVNHEGKVVNFSRSWPIPEINISDRDFFQAMKNDLTRKNDISEPIQSRATGTWTIYLAKQVSGANGEFLGLILGAMEMRYFEEFYQAISFGNDSSAQIQRLDGVMLARFPTTNDIGKVFSSAQHLLRDGVSGTIREPSPIDGRMRLKAAHRLANYPVLVLVTETERAALANWRAMAGLMTLASFGCVISIGIAGVGFGRHSKQQTTIADARAELDRQEDYAVAMGTAIGVARATALEMTHAAEHDFLTGLPNRLLLNDRIGQAIALALRNGKVIALLFLDLDGFKHINDSLGHGVGDRLLQSIAKRLVDCVRSSDTVSRQGGDEFVVLLTEVEQSDDAAIAARRIAQAVTGPHAVDQHEVYVRAAFAARKMLQAVAEPHSVDRHDLHVTASIGVSVYPDDGLDAETLIKNADTAMYQAKEHGRRRFQFFEPEMNVRAVERQFIEEGLRRALEQREFELHYQPVIDLTTGAITGVEALLRWMHPTRGLIPPGEFIPVAEDSGLILAIGHWLRREACTQAQLWVHAGLPVTIAINVSALELRAENFLEGLFAILNETGLDPQLLELELTESVLMKYPDATALILQALRNRGVRVAIDDFGTGYSSLGYLHKLPLDTLKIDQSFIRQISIAGEDTTIVTAVIGIAHNLKLRVIAEGVETLEELTFLRAHQCDEVQGFYFSGPVPQDAITQLLRTGIR
jgi:diguanylate cyclase (GGDEF)-like protein